MATAPAFPRMAQNQWTPSHHASGKGHLEVMKLLLANGADVHAKDQVQSSLVHFVVI